MSLFVEFGFVESSFDVFTPYLVRYVKELNSRLKVKVNATLNVDVNATLDVTVNATPGGRACNARTYNFLNLELSFFLLSYLSTPANTYVFLP
jgi:hypothetical protein